MKKFLLSTCLAAAGLFGASAHAASINFDFTGEPGAGGSGKTTPFLGQPNIFVETFDTPTGGSQCGLDNPGGVIVSGGPFSYRQGPLGTVAAPPAGDSTCYAYAPASGPDSIGSLPNPLPADLVALLAANPQYYNGNPILASVSIDYSPLLASLGGNQFLNYFGLYYGSIDEYNMIEFFNGGTRVATVWGSQIIAECSPTCVSGDQGSDDTNLYVNLILGANEAFTSLRFTTWGIAVEVDNFAVGIGVQQVPEPASLALLGVGLAGLGLARRRKAKN